MVSGDFPRLPQGQGTSYTLPPIRQAEHSPTQENTVTRRPYELLLEKYIILTANVVIRLSEVKYMIMNSELEQFIIVKMIKCFGTLSKTHLYSIQFVNM